MRHIAGDAFVVAHFLQFCACFDGNNDTRLPPARQ